MSEASIVIVYFIVIVSVYFIPSIVAKVRNHHNTMAIFLLNLFLGWSLIGWVAALVWAVIRPPPSSDDST
ncbi:MAG: superinfection immunity protein [Gammaproteobacteria bacterium]|nr:superinfection immunity protein [Gammaproteobacteria bacterium]MYJ73616.1 superinfection immunity protein [Gammaproteobacteria bacterium]